MTAALQSLTIYNSLAGEIIPEEGYLDDLHQVFSQYQAIPSVYCRYVNEYGPKIAAILQPDGQPIHPETWDRVRILIQWFYSQAETVLGSVKDNGAKNQFESQLRSLHAYIHRKNCIGGVTKTVISRNKGEGTTASQRDKFLEEMQVRGWVVHHPDGRYTAVEIKCE